MSRRPGRTAASPAVLAVAVLLLGAPAAHAATSGSQRPARGESPDAKPAAAAEAGAARDSTPRTKPTASVTPKASGGPRTDAEPVVVPVPSRSAAVARPPIVLISLDTLRADHVGAYGYTKDTTPNLDAFARDAVLFEDAFTAGGGTLPAHTTLLTGLPPGVHGVTVQSGATLAAGQPTLARVLGRAGYRTAAFTGGGYVRAQFGLSQGFETFDEAGTGFEEILPKATRWLARDDERPPFVFLHTMDIHSDWNALPYETPPPYRDRFVDPDASVTFDGCRDDRCASKLLAWLNQEARKGSVDLRTYFTPEELAYVTALYDGGVAYTDARLGELLRTLKKTGLYDDAIIVVLSDHGEEFLDHGLLLHEQTYDELVHVPMLVKLPGARHGGERVRGLVAMVDVMPTILAAAGVPAPERVTGTSLLPMIEGHAGGRALVHVYGIPEKLRTPRWSLLRHARAGGKDAVLELYDVRKDPGEKHDLAAARPGVARALSRKLDAIHEAHAAERAGRAAGPSSDLSPDLTRQLEALGYLQK